MRLREIPLQRPEERDRLESQITALQATIANHALTDAQKDSRIQELNAACSQKDSWIAHLEAALHRSTSRPDAEVGTRLLVNNVNAQFSWCASKDAVLVVNSI